MRKKPFIFNFITLILLASIILVPVQIILQMGASEINWRILINQISLFNWIMMSAGLITAIYSYFADKRVIFSSIILFATILINNYLVYSFATNMHKSLPILSSLLSLFILFAIFKNRNFRYTVFNQEKRWWLIPKRHRKTLPIWIQIDDEKCLLARTYDVSKSGAFVSSISGIQSFIEKGIKVGSKVRVLIGDKDNIEFQCLASVIRKSKAVGDYPSGIGLHFDKVKLKERFALNKIITTPSIL
ncbi:PilZ domain-containing protein [Halobacteriovorax sp. HLS]|uniref:PilZ domain-containing protein n=1 Tax=Halobacteriovorax sp. HLS TaxID=2234000 RepID=UPI000FD91323|nr:PilZ domain-containing protein [Halobacteriovorax sp. HLS]